MEDVSKERRRRLTEVRDGLRALRVELARLNHRVSERIELRDIDLECFDLIAAHGELQPKKLAALSGVHAATLTGILDRLESGGWIVRERDAEDRRSVLLRPAPRSAGRVFTHFQGMSDAMDATCADYTDEQLDLIVDFLRRAAEAGSGAADAFRP